jgi:hypothetical protein
VFPSQGRLLEKILKSILHGQALLAKRWSRQDLVSFNVATLLMLDRSGAGNSLPVSRSLLLTAPAVVSSPNFMSCAMHAHPGHADCQG